MSKADTITIDRKDEVRKEQSFENWYQRERRESVVYSAVKEKFEEHCREQCGDAEDIQPMLNRLRNKVRENERFTVMDARRYLAQLDHDSAEKILKELEAMI